MLVYNILTLVKAFVKSDNGVLSIDKYYMAFNHC